VTSQAIWGFVVHQDDLSTGAFCPLWISRLLNGKGRAPDRYQFRISIVPPGRFRRTRHRGVSGGMSPHVDIEIRSRTRLDHNWVRRASGRLEDVSAGPVTNYQVPRTVGTMVPSDA
jgi:hypothetical protein